MNNGFLDIINVLYRGNNHILQQIQSFNNFLSSEMQKIVNKSKKISIEYQKDYKRLQKKNLEVHDFSIKFIRIFYTNPTFKELNDKPKELTPAISRSRNFR